MPRYRVVVDVVTKDDKAINGRQAAKLGDLSSTLVNNVAMFEIEGVDADPRAYEVVSVHQHESTDDRQCPDCRQSAADGWNSANVPQK